MKQTAMDKTNKLQSIINRIREVNGHGAIIVHHYDPEDDDEDELEAETTISISFDLCQSEDPMVVGEEIRGVVGGCDSGAGFGFRDLQLCARFDIS